MSITNPPLLPGVVLALAGTVVQGPPGPQGPDGLSSYALWLAEGNTGTVDDFLLTLIGPTGDDGRPVELQKSATHIQWRYQGDIGWTNLVPLIDFKGDPGNDGLNGTNGTNGTDGLNGADGRGIVSIVRIAGTGAAGTVDTYTITYTTGPTSTFDVTNGANGTNGTNGTDGVDGADGNDGRGTVSVVRTSGTGAAGTTDTYTITFTDASTTTFNVYNGADGAGAGDMTKAVYDSNNDGKVNSADTADAAPWAGITGKPAVIAAGTDAAAARTAINAEQAIAAGATDQYLNGNKSWVDFATSVRASVLTGLSVVTNAAITAGDSVLSAFGKLQAQISAHFGSGGTAHANVVAGGAAGFMTGTDKTKLDGVAANATANSSNAFLLARANHTGTQNVNTLAQSGATASQVLAWNGSQYAPTTIAAGGGLTTVRVTGTTAAYTAAIGQNVSIESTVAVTVTAPPGLTAGQKWGLMVCNGRWDNVVAMNGNKHENLSDATMTLKDNKIALEFEMISTSFGQKVKML